MTFCSFDIPKGESNYNDHRLHQLTHLKVYDNRIKCIFSVEFLKTNLSDWMKFWPIFEY